MITADQQKRISAILNAAIPKGHTWILLVPEIGSSGNGKTTYLTPVNDYPAVAQQLRDVANAIDPQN